MQIGLAFYKTQDHLAVSISDILSKLGHEVIAFEYSETIPQGLDVIFTYGPFGSLAPLGKQLIALPKDKRPFFILWMTEQLANPMIPEWFHYPFSIIRSKIEQYSYKKERNGSWALKPRMRWGTKHAHRFRYYGDLHWLQKAGVLSVLAVGSQWIAEFLRKRGIDAMVAYVGVHPDWYADLEIERDIQVLWLGSIGTDRRGKILEQVRADLEARGIEIYIVDGVANPYVYGDKRTALLNRSKITLNLLRTKWDNHSIRFFLAAPNRCLVISEPTYPHIPLTPGEHYVEAPADELALTIRYYLENEAEQQRIADQAYQFVTTELTMENSLVSILSQIPDGTNNRD